MSLMKASSTRQTVIALDTSTAARAACAQNLRGMQCSCYIVNTLVLER
jgi:hypothetical protein